MVEDMFNSGVVYRKKRGSDILICDWDWIEKKKKISNLVWKIGKLESLCE